MKLHHIANTPKAQRRGGDPQPPQNQQVAPRFAFRAVMSGFMKDLTLRRAGILRPLPLQKDQSPLAAAEGEVLDTGEGKEVLLTIDGHPMRVQVMPAGREASSTVTV